MSRIDDWSDAEKDLYRIGTRALLDDLDRQIQAQREEWASSAALDTTATDEMIRAHNDRLRQIEEEHKAWMAKFLNGDEEGTQETSQQGPVDASGQGAAIPAATAPAGPVDPRAAELERARAIAEMDMAEYAKRRAELGVENPESMHRLFGR